MENFDDFLNRFDDLFRRTISDDDKEEDGIGGRPPGRDRLPKLWRRTKCLLDHLWCVSASSGLDTCLEDERRGEAVRGLTERQRSSEEDAHPSKAQQGGA